MKATPLFLGACAVASLAGAVSGAAINTSVIQHAGVGAGGLPSPSFAFDASDTGLAAQEALPDHYALVTPDGRVEVAELANRGLYAQQRFGWREAEWAPPPVPAFPEPEADPQWSASANDLRNVSEGVPATTAEPAVDRPGEVQNSPAGARIIDVQAALASQSG